MTKQFVTFEIANELKALFFDEPCFTYYHEYDKEIRYPDVGLVQNSLLSSIHIASPLWQQAIDFLRERHDKHIWIKSEIGYKIEYWYTIIGENQGAISRRFYTYNEAREQAILKTIEIIKEKNEL